MAVNSLTPVVSNDDVGSDENCEATESAVTFDVTAGTTYRVAVDGKAGAQGAYEVHLRGPPAHNDFAAPRVLPNSLGWIANSNNEGATLQAGEPEHAGGPGGTSVWFSWTPATSGRAFFSTCDADFDTLLAVYTGSALNALTPVASNDDGSGCYDGGSEVAFDFTAGTTYRIAVDGLHGASGAFPLQFVGGPSNDDFSKPLAAPSSFNVIATGSTRNATRQEGEPLHAGVQGDGSVWLSWTAPANGRLRLDTCDSEFDTLLAVYTGSTVGGLTEVASDDDGGAEWCVAGSSEVVFDVVAGTPYRIALAGAGAAEGSYSLNFDGPPANDAFASATALATAGESRSGDNILASRETGEPAARRRRGRRIGLVPLDGTGDRPLPRHDLRQRLRHAPGRLHRLDARRADPGRRR